jgi:hypothetical protein
MLGYAQPAGWRFATPVTITETSGSSQSAFQASFRINTQIPIGNGWMQPDADDIRMAWNCDGTNPVEFYIQNYVNTDTTQIWVKLDSLAANSTVKMFLFYGNDTASRASTPYIFGQPQSATDSVIPASTNSVVSNSQRGFVFSPNVELLLAHIGKREPTGTTRYVTLFNAATQAIVMQGQVSGPAGVYSYTELVNSGIWLKPGTSYIHTLFQGTGDGYYYGTSTQVGQHLTYGGSMRYCNSCTQNTFPTSSLANYHYGVADFWYFVRTAPTAEPTFVVGDVLLANGPADASLCPTDTLQLNASATGGTPGYTYVWDNNYNIISDTMGNAWVFPDTAYSYSITVTDVDGCHQTDEVMVTPIQFSILTNVVNANCSNEATGSAITAANGTGPFMYEWYNGDTTAQLSNLMPGMYSVEVTDSNGCVLEDTFAVGFVNQAPQPNLGPDTAYCASATPITLNAGAGNTYLWQDGSTAGTFVVTSTGTYSVMVSDSNCSGADSVSIVVNANPVATVTAGATDVCDNDSPVSLTTSPMGGTLAGTGVSGSSFDPNGLTAGIYNITYTYTDGNGCMDMDTTAITVSASPTAGFQSSANLLDVNFTDNSVGASSWSWNFGDGNNSTQQNPTHTYGANGWYNVCLTVTSTEGCENTTCDSVFVSGIAIDDALAGKIDLYPNPATTAISLRQDGSLSGVLAVAIYNLQGAEVMRKDWNTQASTTLTLPVADLATGTYMLVVAGSEGHLSRQFLIRR